MSRLAYPILIILILLIGIGSAFAQDHSLVGLYSDPVRVNKTTPWPTQPGAVELYLVLTRPYDEENSQKVGAVGGFECRVEVPEGDILLDFNSDTLYISVAPLPDLLVGYYEPLGVARNKVVLGRLSFFTMAQPGTQYYLTPPVSFLPTFPGHMAYISVVSNPSLPDEQFLLPMFAAEANDPAFIITTKNLPAEIEGESWDGVKALYR